LKIRTDYLGEIHFEESDIITFPKSILGFKESKFILILSSDESFPFHYLQSIENESLAFIVTNPFLFVEDYDFQLSEIELEELELTVEDSTVGAVTVYTIVNLSGGVGEATVNLAAPIVINAAKNIGKQILIDEDAPIKHPIFDKKEGV